MAFDNAYEAITEENDPRWAFGTGFTDALSGVDTALPSGVDGSALAAYCLMLGDDALIMSHRLQEWCTHAPELEDEVALANLGLDLLGQARVLLARAGTADGTGRGEDDYAFFREAREFRNVRLAELPNGDFAQAMARLLVFASWRLALLRGLTTSRDGVLAAVAERGVRELTYHRDYAAGWVIRLGDGTDFSRLRMREGLADVWPWIDELFTPHAVERELTEAGVAADPAAAKAEFDAVLTEVLDRAGLDRPPSTGRAGVSGQAGRDGVHTEALGFLLAELQSIPRAHPEATW